METVGQTGTDRDASGPTGTPSPPEPVADLVVVYHNARNHSQYRRLVRDIRRREPLPHRVIAVDNRRRNRGYGPGCNHGAFSPAATAPIIGFFNPDVEVSGPFLEQVTATLADPDTVITGCRWGKPDSHLAAWGVSEWVCGAAFFVRRDWFTAVGGFDSRFVWSFEETDLVRQALTTGKRVVPLLLPLAHSSPDHDTPKDAAYKAKWFAAGRRMYDKKWEDQP